jgi:hypothetical protein
LQVLPTSDFRDARKGVGCKVEESTSTSKGKRPRKQLTSQHKKRKAGPSVNGETKGQQSMTAFLLPNR